MAAGRLSRPRQFHRGERNRRAAAARSDQAARCGRAHLQRDPCLRLRIGNRVPNWDWEHARRPGADRRGGRAHFRDGADERLERARYADVGIPAARPIPREEFLHQHLALGGDDGRAGALQEAAAAAGPGAAALFARARGFHLRHPARSASANESDGDRACHHAHELPESLLEHGAAIGPSHREWLQPATRRSPRQRYD